MSDNLPAVGRETLRQLINDNCIYRVPPGSKELPWMEGNGHYGWQFYLRKAVLDPKAIQLIAADFWRRYAPYFKANPFQVAGVEAAAVPILTAIIWHGFDRFGFEVNGFTIRKERKKYGLQNLIEGLPTYEPVMFIDDLTSPAHNAFWHFVNAIRNAGLPLNGLGYVLVRKAEKAGSATTIHTSIGSVAIESMFTLDDFDMGYAEYYAKETA